MIKKRKVTRKSPKAESNKNDVSFIFGFELMLYEHQSTVNLNMPLRDLAYVTTILQGLTIEENLYGQKLVQTAVPKVCCFL